MSEDEENLIAVHHTHPARPRVRLVQLREEEHVDRQTRLRVRRRKPVTLGEVTVIRLKEIEGDCKKTKPLFIANKLNSTKLPFSIQFTSVLSLCILLKMVQYGK